MGNSQGKSSVFGEDHTGLYLDRKPQMLEIAFGCEAKNQYQVNTMKGKNGKGPDRCIRNNSETTYNMWEESECFERVCCKQNRSLTLNVGQGFEKDPNNLLYKFVKPFSCAQGCCMLTSIDMQNGSGQKIASANVGTAPCFSCCRMNVDGKNGMGETVLKTKPVCLCNGNAFCPACCGDQTYPVQRASDGQIVARIIRPQLDCSQCMFQMNSMQIEFDDLATDEERAILTNMTVLIELEYYFPQNN